MIEGSTSAWDTCDTFPTCDTFNNMTGKLSVVINTLNEEKYIEQAIDSVKDFADEILVCDMHSDDNSAIIAKKLGAKVILHKRLNYVEPARNLAISKAANEWILVMDPDEEIPESLGKRLKDIISKDGVTTHVEIPRKNLIFNKWVKTSMWWPDYNIRFFKKGTVTWNNKIHRPPKTEGQGIKLPPEESFAILHHHYDTISQFVVRMNRYTDVQAKNLKEDGVEFHWSELIKQPLNEFLSRYFALRGFEDGLHGLALSFLQACSHLVVYLKLWEMQGFKETNPKLSEVELEFQKAAKDTKYWLKQSSLSKNPAKRVLQKIKNKIS
jgi:glycosyltransferase involved in cell wall biosynthesis